MKTTQVIGLVFVLAMVGCGQSDEGESGDNIAGNESAKVTAAASPTDNTKRGDSEYGPCVHCGKKFKTLGDVYGHVDNCPKAPKAPTVDELPYHYGYVNSVAFSRDGKWIVSGSYDGTIRIWDAKSEKQIRKMDQAKGFYNTVAISPNSKRIVSGSSERKVEIWDAESGKLLKSLPGHRGEVFSVALDANASRIVSGSGDGTIKIWDAESGEEIRTLKGHRDDVKSVAFSPDGKRVVSGSDDETAKVWDVESGKVLKNFTGHTFTVESVAFIHGGKRVFSTGEYIKIWDAGSGEVVKDFKRTGVGFIFSAAMSPNGERIVLGGGLGKVVIMNAESGKVLKKIEGHELAVMSVAISADGKWIVSGSGDETFRVWTIDGEPQNE